MSDAPVRFDFGLNPTAAVALHHVGEEAEPVLVIDGLMRTPAAMVEFAAREADFDAAAAGENFYPGVQAPAPLEYVSLLGRTLTPLIQKAFGLPRARPANASCKLSLVTLPPEALNLAQRLPHIDTVDPLQFAVLHFFCEPRFGGTAFYRHPDRQGPDRRRPEGHGRQRPRRRGLGPGLAGRPGALFRDRRHGRPRGRQADAPRHAGADLLDDQAGHRRRADAACGSRASSASTIRCRATCPNSPT
jgi:hypothetical protein